MTSPSSNRRLAACLAVSILASALPAVPRVAHAEPSAADKTSARDFMREGKELRAKDDHAGALKKFQAAYALVPSPITGFAVAQEQVALGQLVEARETLGDVQRMPLKPTETEDGKKARQDADALLADLVARVPVLEISLQGAQGPVKLAVDGKEVPAVAASEGLRVNPGTHGILAKVAGAPDQTASVDVKEGERKKIVLTFPPSAASSEPPKSVTAKPAAPGPSEPTPPVAEAPKTAGDGKPDGTMRTIGLVVGGVGIAALGTGLVLGLAARSKYEDAKSARCAPVCDAEGKTETDDARSLGNVGTVVFVVGAVLTIGGATLWLTAKPTEGTPAVTAVKLGPGTFSIAGSF